MIHRANNVPSNEVLREVGVLRAGEASHIQESLKNNGY